MQPLQYFGGHMTADLTEGKVHKIAEKDGTTRFVVLFPKVWEKFGDREEKMTMRGKMDVQMYLVTGWEEHELALVPK